ncbi:MAG: FeS-binding protein, partial [Bacillota bacterium]
MYDEIIQLFEIPCEAQEFIPFYLTGKEMDAIAVMKREAYLPSELEVLLKPIAGNPATLIQEAYSRGVFNKVEREGVIYYQAANFYRRIAYFAQYEPEAWVSIPEENRKQIDAWYVKEYAQGAIPRLKLSQQDPTQLIENAFFYTLQETLDLIDRQEQEEFCLVPCNCKAVSLGCADTKPQTVCLGINFREINSDWDRGHGTLIHKEEAKKLVRLANQKGLMQTTETKWGICNCCGCCCYPIRASEQIGAKGSWPKQVYE